MTVTQLKTVTKRADYQCVKYKVYSEANNEWAISFDLKGTNNLFRNVVEALNFLYDLNKTQTGVTK
mgnify:CR=1 FL=1